MMAQTATELLYEFVQLKLTHEQQIQFEGLFQQAKQMEEKNLKTAMIYALDEDGHTGDWKIRFVNDYYNQTFNSSKEKYDQDESGYPIH